MDVQPFQCFQWAALANWQSNAATCRCYQGLSAGMWNFRCTENLICPNWRRLTLVCRGIRASPLNDVGVSVRFCWRDGTWRVIWQPILDEALKNHRGEMAGSIWQSCLHHISSSSAPEVAPGGARYLNHTNSFYKPVLTTLLVPKLQPWHFCCELGLCFWVEDRLNMQRNQMVALELLVMVLVCSPVSSSTGMCN